MSNIRVDMLLGNGDVLTSCGRRTEHGIENVLVLTSVENPMPIGTYTDEHSGKRSTDVGSSIELEFTNPDSVQVVIDALEQIKSNLKDGE